MQTISPTIYLHASMTRHIHSKKVAAIIRELYPESYFNSDHVDWYVNKIKKETPELLK